jgi:pyruvate,water dikinase
MDDGWIVPLRAATDPRQWGEKAAALARALAAGLAVPPGFVLSVQAHRESPGQVPSPSLARAIAGSARGLGRGPLAVRTSSPEEDLSGASAAGLFCTVLGVARPRDVPAAVAACWRGAASARLAAYRSALSRPSGAVSVAVIIQRQVAAPWAGVLFTRDPRTGPGVRRALVELVEGSTALVTAGLGEPRRWPIAWPDEDPVAGHGGPLPAARRRALGEVVVRAEAVAGGPADVEVALPRRGAPWVLQVRPITAFSTADVEPDLALPAGRRDAEHNPEPLSPLHASLVRHLDRAARLPFRLAVEDGYLVTAPRSSAGAAGAPPADVLAGWSGPLGASLAAAADRVADQADAAAPLGEVLAAFVAFYEAYASTVSAGLRPAQQDLARTLGAATLTGAVTATGRRGALHGIPVPLLGALEALAVRVAPDAVAREALSRGRVPRASGFRAAWKDQLAEVGDLAPAWDLACPTYREQPAPLLRAIARLAARPHRGATSAPRDPGRQALAIDEQDDLLFARALAGLRRACLAAGRARVASGELPAPDAVFQLDLAELVPGLEREPCAPVAVTTSRASPAAPGPAGPAIRGVAGGGGCVTGRAARLDHLTPGALPEPGRILVCAAALPSLVPYLVSAAGLVTDQGGLLGHGAILARELGIPAVLGTRTGTRRIPEGAWLFLDADHGMVILLPPPGPC